MSIRAEPGGLGDVVRIKGYPAISVLIPEHYRHVRPGRGPTLVAGLVTQAVLLNLGVRPRGWESGSGQRPPFILRLHSFISLCIKINSSRMDMNLKASPTIPPKTQNVIIKIMEELRKGASTIFGYHISIPLPYLGSVALSKYTPCRMTSLRGT